ncbi:MAG: YifB family Mg chelatase-like AAA ATPase [Gemmatimonadaceae bacterium]|nr:YifB family Mg chelatase-like AAA ATPase [Gemmatimonadaceae bacterium]
MLAAIQSAAVLGVEAYAVTVEVDAAPGLPGWTMVGLPSGSVKEARERVGAALVNAGFVLPPRRWTVNLSPADIRKDGTAFDLPIALGVLVASGQLEAAAVEGLLVAGELGLDGSIRPIRGALPLARAARGAGSRALVLPAANAAEAGLLRDVRLAPADSLDRLVVQLRRGSLPDATTPAPPAASGLEACFSEVVGQPLAKRALEIAAAGGHNLLIIGPPGAGKTMLARRLPGILPPLDDDALLEVVAVHSVGGILPTDRIPSRTPPFRAPHHTISLPGLIGGGPGPRPGEVSLAHRGVLFLDELLELPRYVLDAMRQPLEDARVTIVRASQSVVFPARFQLVGAANPCPCGHDGDASGRCRCSAADIARYRARLSGPLADRVDLHVRIGAVALAALGATTGSPEETSARIRLRVAAARARQADRYSVLPGVRVNAETPGRWLQQHGEFSAEARALLTEAAERLRFSARAYHRVLRVARTVADLGGEAAVSADSIAEALLFRGADSGTRRV